MSTTGISRKEILQRQDRTRTLVGKEKLDAVIIVGRSAYDRPGHLAYLTNHFPPFPSTPFTQTDRGMGYGIFFLPVDGEATLLIDQQSQAALNKETVAVQDTRVARNMMTGLVDLLRERKVAQGLVGIVGEDLLPTTIYRHVIEKLPDLCLEAADDLISLQRLIKSEAEIQLMRQAAEIAGAGHQAALETLKAGARENEICAEGTAAALRAGADFVRYFRVSSDPQLATTMRWPQASEREIQAGEVVMMDIIGAYGGYHFDVFRCSTAGEPEEEKRQLLETALRATEAAVAAAQPGTPVQELVSAAGRVFEKADCAQYSRSFMGHGIGLETVEPPLISPGDRTVLQPGMVLCIEPGLRIPGVGGFCIEQEVVIGREGPELITKFPARLW